MTTTLDEQKQFRVIPLCRWNKFPEFTPAYPKKPKLFSIQTNETNLRRRFVFSAEAQGVDWLQNIFRGEERGGARGGAERTDLVRLWWR